MKPVTRASTKTRSGRTKKPTMEVQSTPTVLARKITKKKVTAPKKVTGGEKPAKDENKGTGAVVERPKEPQEEEPKPGPSRKMTSGEGASQRTPTPGPSRKMTSGEGASQRTPTPGPSRKVNSTGGPSQRTPTPGPSRKVNSTGGSSQPTPTPGRSRKVNSTGGPKQRTPTPGPSRKMYVAKGRGRRTPTPGSSRKTTSAGGSSQRTPTPGSSQQRTPAQAVVVPVGAVKSVVSKGAEEKLDKNKKRDATPKGAQRNEQGDRPGNVAPKKKNSNGGQGVGDDSAGDGRNGNVAAKQGNKAQKSKKNNTGGKKSGQSHPKVNAAQNNRPIVQAFQRRSSRKSTRY